MTTTLDLIEATRQHLVAAGRPEINKLNGAMDASQTSLTFEYPAQAVQRGAVLSIDLEEVLVWVVAGQTATVQRGFNGTTAATHADDSLLYVNDRQSATRILRELNNELRSFSSPVHGLYRVRTVDLTWSAVRSGYDLTGVTDLIDILAVEGVGVLAGDRSRVERYRVIRNQDTADFPSGMAIQMYDGGVIPGRTVRVTYRAPFASLSTLTDDVEAVSFLPATAHDIPPLGAAARLLAGRESHRVGADMQPEPRAAGDVPPGANTGASRALLGLRNLRLSEEAARLHAAYPSLARRAG